MTLKYNFGLIKNKKVGFKININNKELNFSSILLNVKQTNSTLKFIFENGIFEVNIIQFNTMNIRKIDDIIWFIQTNDINNISGYVVFSLFDTYGFPMEITKEIFLEKGKNIDRTGFSLLQLLQKEKSSNTYKQTSAF